MPCVFCTGVHISHHNQTTVAFWGIGRVRSVRGCLRVWVCLTTFRRNLMTVQFSLRNSIDLEILFPIGKAGSLADEGRYGRFASLSSLPGGVKCSRPERQAGLTG